MPVPDAAAHDVRAKLHELMLATIADRRHWDYRAVRPLPVPHSWQPGQHVVSDCSKGCQYLCRWAGGPDPMDPHSGSFGPYGNSTTICSRLQHLDHARDLQVGDIVTFGVNGNEHAAMCFQRGEDPLLWSDGHQGAPNTYRLSQDHRVHQFLRLPAPVHLPTPAERLRAKTGYWAWVQWKLGEGDWKSYQPEAPAVRPNVPARIPSGWWRDYARFLLARRETRPNRERKSTPG